MPVLIREPTVGDADDLGRVHVRAWQAAYRGGLMPDAYLDGLSVQERADQWREALGNPPRPRFRRLAAVVDDGPVVGFALIGPAGGDPDADGGELFAINVEPDQWGRGVGPALMDAATDGLRQAGFSTLVLWVHPGNDRARAFYEARGWALSGSERDEDVLGVRVPEVQYTVEL